MYFKFTINPGICMFDQTDQKIIHTLFDADEYISGNQLGDMFGMSRAGIAKRLRALGAVGLPLKKKAATGYRLVRDYIPLSIETILDGIEGEARPYISGAELHLSVDSTNSRMEALLPAAGQAAVVIAETQTAGKGRRANQWQSTPFKNLQLSLAWTFPVWPANITALSLAAGVIVMDTLKSLGVEGIQLKWPNDIYLNGQKLGGILINIQGQSGGEAVVICGIGINIQLDAGDKKNIKPSPIDLAGAGYRNMDRNAMVSDLVTGWVELCREFTARGFEPYRDRWHAAHLYQGQQVVASRDDVRIRGPGIGR